MDDRELEEREDIETGKQRTILHRERAYTWLVWLAVGCAITFTITCVIICFVTIRYGVPAAKEIKESNEQMAAGYRTAVPEFMKRLDEKDRKIDAILSNVETITGNSAKASEEIATNSPKAFQSLGDLTRAGVAEIHRIGKETHSFISDTNRSLNGEQGIFAALTDTTTRAGVMISNQDTALQALVTAGTTTVDEGKALLSELRAIVASDEWKQIRGEVLSSIRNVTSLTKHTAETVIEGRDILKTVKEYLQKYAPGILASLEKISKESSRYQKAALLANIFRLLAIGLGAL